MLSTDYNLGVFQNQSNLIEAYSAAMMLEDQLKARVGDSGVTYRKTADRGPDNFAHGGSRCNSNGWCYWEDIGNTPWEMHYPLVNTVSYVFKCTASFSQVVHLFGHTLKLDGQYIHHMAAIIYDITDSRVVLHMTAMGDFAIPYQQFNGTAGHVYHVIFANLKTVYCSSCHNKLYSALLAPPALRRDNVVVIDANRTSTLPTPPSLAPGE